MFEIRIYKKKNKKIDSLISTIKYPNKEDAIKAYELLKRQSSEGYKCFPVDSEIISYRKTKAKDIIYPNTYKIWKCEYNENGKTNHKPHIDERYKWTFEEIEHPKKGQIVKQIVPEFKCIKYPNTIVTYPKEI